MSTTIATQSAADKLAAARTQHIQTWYRFAKSVSSPTIDRVTVVKVTGSMIRLGRTVKTADGKYSGLEAGNWAKRSSEYYEYLPSREAAVSFAKQWLTDQRDTHQRVIGRCEHALELIKKGSL